MRVRPLDLEDGSLALGLALRHLANTGVFTNSLWFLDAQGRSTASFNLPPGLPGAQGLDLHHAVVALTYNLASTFVSEPASLRLY